MGDFFVLDSCALQYYYFSLWERNEIIEYLKKVLRSFPYLKTKPSLGNIFDISLQNTLREFNNINDYRSPDSLMMIPMPLSVRKWVKNESEQWEQQIWILRMMFYGGY